MPLRKLSMPQNFFAIAIVYFCLFSANILAHDDSDEINLILDIDTLYTPVASLPVYGETAINLLEELQTKHYSGIEIDDNFSSAVFDNLLDTLDGSNSYFLKEDVDELSIFRYTLDDSLQSGSVEAGFEIYNRYYKRVLERLI